MTAPALSFLDLVPFPIVMYPALSDAGKKPGFPPGPRAAAGVIIFLFVFYFSGTDTADKAAGPAMRHSIL